MIQVIEQGKAGAAGAKPNIPGGAYTSEQNADKTWNIRSVPIFAEHDVTVKGETRRVGQAWQVGAHKRQASRIENDSYMAPLHVHHHAFGKDTQPAGFFQITDVAQGMYDGHNLWMTFADLLQVPNDVYQRIRAGELTYRSVEIHDITKTEIDSVALLNDEVPFFRLSLLTIGDEAPFKGEVEVSEVRMAVAANTPVRMYRAFGNGTRVFMNATSIRRNEMKTKEQIATDAKAAEAEKAKKYADDLAEEIRKKKEAEKTDGGEDGEKLELGADEGLDKGKVAATLTAIAQQIAQLATALGTQETPGQPAAPAPVEMAAKDTIPMKGAETGQISEAEINTLPQAYRAPYLKLMGRVDAMERGQEVETAVSVAVTELEAYGAEPEGARKKLYSIARSSGVKAMQSYVDGAKAHGKEDPLPGWDSQKPLEAQVTPAMQKYARLGQDGLEKALKYSEEFDSLSKRMNFSFGRGTFIDEQLRGEGFDIPVVEDKKEA